MNKQRESKNIAPDKIRQAKNWLCKTFTIKEKGQTWSEPTLQKQGQIFKCQMKRENRRDP